MATITAKQKATEEDLLRCPDDGHEYELVDGEIVQLSPAGRSHGRVAMELAVLLGGFVKSGGLGACFDGQTGFRLPNGNVRSPDLAFVAAARDVPDASDDPYGGPVPDLAVEIVSPGDTAREVLEKVGEYLQAGVRLVWVIDPPQRRAVVHRSLSDTRTLGPDDELDGEDVVPGFRLLLRDVLDRSPRS